MLLQGFTGAFGLMRKCHGEGWAVGDGEIWVIGEGDDGLCGSGLQGYFHKRIFIQGLVVQTAHWLVLAWAEGGDG